MNLMNAMMGQAMNRMMAQFQGNPFFQQAQQMSQGKTDEELKQTCMNLCRSRGINFDQAMNQFQSQFFGR